MLPVQWTRVGSAVALCCGAASAQWSESLLSPSPAGVNSAACAFEFVTGRTVLFGGSEGGLAAVDRTWSFDGTQWVALTPPLAPPPRHGAAMAGNLASGTLVLYGGMSSVFGPVLDDTWEWNGTTWRQLATVGSPGGRASAPMVYDVLRNRMVLHGGRRDIVNIAGETWEFDGIGWSFVTTAQSPGPVREAAMAYELARGRTLLFGGFHATSGTTAETWAFDGLQWTRLTPSTSPPARQQAGMVYDWADGSCLLFGGTSGTTFDYLDDTWSFDGVDWTLQPGPRPAGRTLFAMAHDPLRTSTVLIGGSRIFSQQQLATNWTFGPLSTPLAPGCAGAAGVPRLSTSLPTVGSAVQVTLDRLLPSATAAALVFGFAAQSIDLGPAGLPGCTLASTIDRVDALVASGGTASHTFAVPADPALAGFEFFLTGISFDPINAFGAVLSDSVRALIGR
ncbi:MAG: kelch repeat-containing protein [Planctomycetota bacterium]